jgi:sirohydrochlorin cobaltochelatase
MNTPILLVTFGAMSASAREWYASIEREVRIAFPGREVRWAYMAASLVAQLKRRENPAETLAEAYARLRGDGFNSVAVQSLHLVPGEKHHEVLGEDAQGLTTSFGAPLLETTADLDGVVSRLLADLPNDGPVLVVAHRHRRGTRFNTPMDALGVSLSKARSNIHLASLDGNEDPVGLERFTALARSAGRIHVCPFFLVMGKHMAMEIEGSRPGSLKSRLAVPDFSCGKALGLQPWVRLRFLAKLGAAIARLEGDPGTAPGRKPTLPWPIPPASRK